MSTALTQIVVEHEGHAYPLWRNGDGQPRAKDLDVAAWLEFERPRKIRELIQRHAASLGEVRSMVGQTSARGGRPGVTYYLTEDQVLFLAGRSETPKATQILKAMVAVFLAARRGQLRDPDLSAGLDELRAVVGEELDRKLAPLTAALADGAAAQREMAAAVKALAEAVASPRAARRAPKLEAAPAQVTLDELIDRAVRKARAEEMPELLLDLKALRVRLGIKSDKALRSRLDRPFWAWLRELGDRRRAGRGRLWLWAEVEAELQRRGRSLTEPTPMKGAA